MTSATDNEARPETADRRTTDRRRSGATAGCRRRDASTSRRRSGASAGCRRDDASTNRRRSGARTARRKRAGRGSATLLCTLLATLGLLLPVAAGPLHAQQDDPAEASSATRPSRPFHASAYLPLDHWAYPVLDHWIARGLADDLSPTVRPYTRMQVARALLGLGAGVVRGTQREWAERLRAELAPELVVLEATPGERTGHNLTLYATAGATYASQTHRDPLRPELEGRFAADRLLEHFFIEGHGNLGPVAGGVAIGRDGIFLADAQYPDGRVVPDLNAPILDEFGTRVQEGYLEVQSRYASLFFGRMYRNWGLPGLHGFTWSDYAYSQEALSYRVGTDRIFLTGAFAPFSDFRPDTTRYFSIHRLEVRPWSNFVAAISEAVIHGGPSQPLVFSLINPIGFWHISAKDQPLKNTVGELDLWWRPLSGVALYGSLLFDTTNTPRTSNSCCGMGGSLGVDLAGLLPGWIFRLQGSAIQSLVYRTEVPWEEWSVERIGLGWDKTDLYLATLEASWLGPAGLRLAPRLDLQIRGEGDFREPRPPNEELPDVPRILIGESETTLRPSLAGRWRTEKFVTFDLEWDIGVNIIRDHAHQAGVDRTEFVGTLKAIIETPRWIVPLGE